MGLSDSPHFPNSVMDFHGGFKARPQNTVSQVPAPSLATRRPHMPRKAEPDVSADHRRLVLASTRHKSLTALGLYLSGLILGFAHATARGFASAGLRKVHRCTPRLLGYMSSAFYMVNSFHFTRRRQASPAAHDIYDPVKRRFP
jgi:hypothetical protein